MKKYLTIILLIFSCAAFYACSKKVVKTETGEAGAAQTSPNKSSEEAKTVEKTEQKEFQAAVIPSEAMPSERTVLDAKSEIRGVQDIFFDFDRFTIREDARPALEQDAKYLKASKDSDILIEGHCDERGTSEYNIALGERRAQSAKKYLIDLGIDPSRISTVSYGKEKPFCTDHNEECWQENRRAHFAIK